MKVLGGTGAEATLACSRDQQRAAYRAYASTRDSLPPPHPAPQCRFQTVRLCCGAARGPATELADCKIGKYVRAALPAKTYQGESVMKAAVRRATLVILVFALMFGGISLIPEIAEGVTGCYYCKSEGFWFTCMIAGKGDSGRTTCYANACGSCCLTGSTCSGGTVNCFEVAGEIICEEIRG